MTALIDSFDVNPPACDWLLQLEEIQPSAYHCITDGTFAADALCSLHMFHN